MEKLNILLERICDDEDFRERLCERFDESIRTDTEPINFRRIATQYLDNENQRELIDDIFISMCGWSFSTLVENTSKFMEDEDDNK